MRVLAIGAHPDDIEIGCAGTLLTLQEQRGAEIYLLLMTRGEASTIGSSLRMEEQEASARVLGVKDVFYGNLRDTAIPLLDAIAVISTYVAELAPDYVFTHHVDDTHQDHRTVAYATKSVCRTIGNVLCYESVSTETFHPTLFVDIDKVFSRKCEAIAKHASQVNSLNLMEYIQGLAVVRARRMPCDMAEGLLPHNLFWMR